MTTTLKVKIDGKECQVRRGEYILEAARRNEIYIPSFCRHESLAGLGCCRICVVEVNEGGKNRVVVSCVYPLEKDCEVFTQSEKIMRIRRAILSMLRGRAPGGEQINALCGLYGVPAEHRYAAPSDGGAEGARSRLASRCILCGLCVEACGKLGTGAISAVGRGTGKKISTPYDEASPDCVGCGSCAAVCPADAIECAQTADSRVIWGKTFALVRCEQCGAPFATKEELVYAADAPEAAAALCETCRRKKSAGVLASVYGIRTAQKL